MNLIQAIEAIDVAGYNHVIGLTPKQEDALEASRKESISEICDAVKDALKEGKIQFTDVFEESFEFADYVAWVLSGAPFEPNAPYLGYERQDALAMINDKYDELIDSFATWLLDAGDTTYTIKLKRKLGL